MNSKTTERILGSARRGFRVGRRRGDGRRTRVAHRLRRSRQHAAVEQEGRRLPEQDRRGARRSARHRRAVLLAPVVRARADAHHHQRGQLRSVDGHGDRHRRRRDASPLYRSTFVLVYRGDQGIVIKDLDDPALAEARIGVYQVSAIRQALAAHGVMQNTVIQYLSHDGDLVPENQPSYQVQQVIDRSSTWPRRLGPDGGLLQGDQESAAGDPAGQPDGGQRSARVRHGDGDAARPARGQGGAIEKAMRDRRTRSRQILVEYGVPLVKCADCVIDGDLPSHGPYKPATPQQRSGRGGREATARQHVEISRNGSRRAPIRTPSSATRSSPTISSA